MGERAHNQAVNRTPYPLRARLTTAREALMLASFDLVLLDRTLPDGAVPRSCDTCEQSWSSIWLR
ncbi:hypothetical protein GCM10009022_37420 [Vreelandella titanicae]|nr:hypothetical protein CXF94_05420 [Halomonas sp. Choline-3u-9]|tara:strand:- start:1367 stop:1561 length:195 start_codon:yes stop_codon:yes gene_type:complete